MLGGGKVDFPPQEPHQTVIALEYVVCLGFKYEKSKISAGATLKPHYFGYNEETQSSIRITCPSSEIPYSAPTAEPFKTFIWDLSG